MGGVSPIDVLQWSLAQWLCASVGGSKLQRRAWASWTERFDGDEIDDILLDCPVLDFSTVSDVDSILEMLETKYGTNWREKPLLLRGLWSPGELNSSERRLSLQGLLGEHLIIPYFTNASASYALSPDSQAPVSSIVRNMTMGLPHKIGTQYLVQRYPELIEEVAPTHIVTRLFGNYFQPSHVRGMLWGLLPALTTVPIFVAQTTTNTAAQQQQQHAKTDLHCEPIGNIAVQLQGSKQWTLISPRYTFRLKPAVAPDGRAFFASFLEERDFMVPRYKVTTHPGDALWVPTWTWHRVDYLSPGATKEISIGGSLFHFRAWNYMTNNPVLALLIVPALIKEVIGYNMQ